MSFSNKFVYSQYATVYTGSGKHSERIQRASMIQSTHNLLIFSWHNGYMRILHFEIIHQWSTLNFMFSLNQKAILPFVVQMGGKDDFISDYQFYFTRLIYDLFVSLLQLAMSRNLILPKYINCFSETGLYVIMVDSSHHASPICKVLGLKVLQTPPILLISRISHINPWSWRGKVHKFKNVLMDGLNGGL